MECGQHGVGIRLARAYDSETTVSRHLSMAVPAMNVLAANVFGTGIFHSLLLP